MPNKYVCICVCVSAHRYCDLRHPPKRQSLSFLVLPTDGDGKSELVVGYTDRVVRAFRWEDSSDGSENISGQLVLLKKWLLEGQVGSPDCGHL